jgi:hypothetical protein
MARRVSAQRLFEKTYKVPYGPFIEREHINRPHEILHELDRWFVINRRRYFPFAPVPAVNVNLVIGLSLAPRAVPLD